MTLHTQWITMGVMILSGLYIGIVTDTLRRLFISWHIPSVLRLFFKIIFWVSQTIIVYFILYKVNNGLLRFYIFLACLLGFSMYVVLVRATYIVVLEWTIKVIITIANTFYRLLLRPLWLLFYFILRQLYALLMLCQQVLWYLLKLLFYTVIWLLKQIYKLLPKKYNENITKIISTCSTMVSTFILQLKQWIKRG